MHTDGREIEPGHVLRAPVCIIGSGPAGIAVALELAGHGVSSVLLESGGLAIEAEPQALNQGRASGRLHEGYVQGTRLRGFGGTTHHWSGNCRPLDPIDFEARPGAGLPGWPIDREALDPYYARAVRWVDVEPFDESLAALPGLDDVPLEFADGSHARNRLFHKSRPTTRFGERYREQVVSSDRVQLVTHATVRELETHADGQSVARARVASGAERSWSVAADRYVVAAGGIENARLLLLSRGRHPQGLGNGHDLVGRYFADHGGLGDAAEVALWQPLDELDVYNKSARYGDRAGMVQAVLAPRPDLMRRANLRNCALQRRKAKQRGGIESWFRARREAEAEVVAFGSRVDARRRGRTGSFSYTWMRLLGMFEPAPSASNRVTLGTQLDALGQPRAEVHWSPSAGDLESLRRGIEAIGAELVRSGQGRLWLPDAFDVSRIGTGSHHMGTTRMHVSPREGVVDANARVHDVRNLWIAGSSVFASYGYANPTITLLALGIRLADHLAATSGRTSLRGSS